MNDLVRFALVAFFPRDGELPGLAELGVDEKIARLRRESTALFWFGLVAAAVFFQISPIVTIYRPWPAAVLSDEELDRHAYKLGTHPVYLVRQLMVLLKLIAGVFWGESPEIRGFIHLPAYGEDPGTRRMEAFVPAAGPGPARAPVETLVQLGRREVGRGREASGSLSVDHEAA